MDTTQISALVAVITALPLNGLLLFIIIVLWRRLNTLTDDYQRFLKDSISTLKGNPPPPPVDTALEP